MHYKALGVMRVLETRGLLDGMCTVMFQNTGLAFCLCSQCMMMLFRSQMEAYSNCTKNAVLFKRRLCVNNLLIYYKYIIMMVSLQTAVQY